MKPIAKGYLVDKRLSASQIQSALNGYSDYYKKYILGLSFSNKYMIFGTQVHEQIQSGELAIPIANGANEVNFNCDYNGVMLNGFFDREAKNEIIEIKTSKDITDFKKYRLQCDLYQFVSKKPVRLILVETTEIDGTLDTTGNYKDVMHVYNEEQIKKDIAEAITLIESYGIRYQAEAVDAETEKLTAEYQNLKAEIESLEARQSVIKELVKEKHPEGYKSDNTTVFYTERKSYNYPENITQAQAQIASEEKKLKEIKTEFEKTSTDYKSTKSITIK